MTDTLGTRSFQVHLPGHNPLATTEAREQYVQSLRRQGKISADLEVAIREDRPITAAKRQEIEDARHRALADADWLQRHRRGDQEARSQHTEWTGWLGRPVVEG